MEFTTSQLQSILSGAQVLAPEWTLCAGILIPIILNVFKVVNHKVYAALTFLFVTAAAVLVVINWPYEPRSLFGNMLHTGDFSSACKLLFALGVVFAILMSLTSKQIERPAEYFSLLTTVGLGANLLVMSSDFTMLILSFELISISSYVLAGFHFSKTASEGSLKYFLFGSAATAVMIYGISLLFGLTGTLHFTSGEFASRIISITSPLLPVAIFFVLSGFLFKTSAVPFHLWAPDVYEAAPMPIVAFLSVVPKIAGIAALIKFTLAIHVYGQSSFDWQTVIAIVALLSIVVGNFAALSQKTAKRMMAYSSIAQAGFMIAAMAPLDLPSTRFMIYYFTVFAVMNFLVFIILQQFETTYHIGDISSFRGLGKKHVLLSIALLVGLISLTGLPPTAGFNAKLFIFSAIWEAYQQSGKPVMLWLLIGGLLNTVISLFFYLKIPFYLFIKENPSVGDSPIKFSILTNLLCIVLVVWLLILFFYPSLLMGWVNRVNFVL